MPILAPANKVSVERKVVRAACPHDCPDTCAILVTVEHGVAVKVEGAKDHPFTAGTLCTKVSRYLERTYSKERVLFPQKRIGPKGRGELVRISWDEALDTIAAVKAPISNLPSRAMLDFVSLRSKRV